MGENVNWEKMYNLIQKYNLIEKDISQTEASQEIFQNKITDITFSVYISSIPTPQLLDRSSVSGIL